MDPKKILCFVLTLNIYSRKIFVYGFECLNNENAFMINEGKASCVTSCLCPPKVDNNFISYRGCQACCCNQKETSLEKELKEENLHLRNKVFTFTVAVAIGAVTITVVIGILICKHIWFRKASSCSHQNIVPDEHGQKFLKENQTFLQDSQV